LSATSRMLLIMTAMVLSPYQICFISDSARLAAESRSNER
jgi:hypothetical protein